MANSNKQFLFISFLIEIVKGLGANKFWAKVLGETFWAKVLGETFWAKVLGETFWAKVFFWNRTLNLQWSGRVRVQRFVLGSNAERCSSCSRMHHSASCLNPKLCWAGLGAGLGWAGLGGAAGRGWAGLGWAGLGWAGLGGLGWAGLGWAGLCLP